MSKNLVIVESPAKAKTIKKYLGSDFEFMASYGHVRDLVPKEVAVDTDHGFEMRYEVIEKNEKHVKSIEKALKKADALYLATDPDREGEAISWHLLELLKESGALDDKAVHRVHFYEITKKAVREAVDEPAVLSTDLIFFGEPGRDKVRRPYEFRPAWHRTLKQAGIKGLRFHDLRHEAVSRLVEAGLGDQEAATISGHKSMQMLRRYTHLRAEDLVARLDQLMG